MFKALPRLERRLIISLGLAVLLLLVFAGILDGLHEQDAVAAIDTTVRGFAIAHRSAPLTAIFEAISDVASIHGTLMLLLLVGLLSWRAPHRRAGVVLATGALCAAVVTVAIKLLVARERPDIALRLVHEASFSFPSGHTMNAIIVFGLIGYMLARCVPAGWRHWLIGTITALAILSVGLSRIYLGVHYPSDVLGSLCLGGAALILLVGWTTLRERVFARTMFDRGLIWRLLWAVLLTLIMVVLIPTAFA